MKARQPALFVGHGVPALLASDADPTRAWLGRFGALLRANKPQGVLCVSAHFVAPTFCVTTSEAPALEEVAGCALPPIEHRPRGSVALARRILEHLLPARIKATADPSRGLDHGAWLPLSLLFPEGDVPVVELSLQASEDPVTHFAVGRALEPLRDEGILVLGSGSLTHDLVDLERISGDPDASGVLGERSRRFQAWVTDLLTGSAPYTRGRGLTRFRDHPDAHVAHATGEHLMPLLVVAGAASRDTIGGNACTMVHAGSQRGLSMAAFSFQP